MTADVRSPEDSEIHTSQPRRGAGVFTRRATKNFGLPFVLVLLVASFGVLPKAAWATAAADNELYYAGPGANARGHLQWTSATDYIASIDVVPDSAFSSGWCLVTVFDWDTNEGENGAHFDPRAARTCNPNAGIWRSVSDYGKNRILVGINRGGVCYGPYGSNGSTVNGPTADCDQSPWAAMTVRRDNGTGPYTAFPNNCIMGWWINAGTTTLNYGSGGVSNSCSS